MNNTSDAPASFAFTQANRSTRQQRPVVDTSVQRSYESAGQNAFHRQASTSSHTSANGRTAAGAESFSPPDSDLNMFTDHLQSRVLSLHDFTPIAPNATCLSFRAGQVIQVLNRDPSGWWDGELEGRRGWFPSNYVTGLDQIGKLREEVLTELHHKSHGPTRSTSSHGDPKFRKTPDSRDADQLLREQDLSHPSSLPFEKPSPSLPSVVRKTSLPVRRLRRSDASVEGRSESPSLSLYQAIAAGSVSSRSISPSFSMNNLHQPLLTPLLHAVSLLNRAVAGRRQAHYQPSTACVISCVRSLLMSTECLHRDAPVLKRVPILARERKVILGNLATLVAQARQCSESPTIEDDEQEGWQESVRQAELEQQDWELEQMIRMGGEVLRNVTRFLELCEENGVDLPVSRHASSYSASASGSGSGSSGSDGDIQRRIRMDLGVATRTGYDRAASGSTATPIAKPPNLATLRTKSLNDLRARRRMQHLTRSKQLPFDERVPTTASLSSMSSLSTSSTTSAAAASFPSGPCTPGQVLGALRTSNDALLSSIAAFIGHVHSYGRAAHATSKGHLIEVARETVDMVRQLLTIVEAVVRHPDVVSRSQNLQIAKVALFETTNALVEAVRAMTSSSPQSSRSEEEERWRTLQGATAVLKVAGDCVTAIKVCLSRPIGGTPFVVCLPSLSSRAAAEARVSGLRRRSASVTGFSSVAPVKEVYESVAEEDVTIQAVETSADAGTKEKDDAPQQPSYTSESVNSTADSEELEDDMISDRSRRSSIAETTPATSVMPEEKELSLPDKILHGELPLPPLPSPGPPTPPHSAFPSTPDSPLPSQPPVDLEAVIAFTHDYDVRDIAYNSDGAVVGATLSVMVEKMTPHDALVDPTFQQIFMMTWRLFVSPADLVTALITRYNLSSSTSLSEEETAAWVKRKATPVKLRVANFIKTWLESSWRPQTDDVTLTQLSQFVRGTVASQFPAPAQRILDIIRARTISDEAVLNSLSVERTRDRLRDIPSHPLSPTSPSEIPRPSITKTLFSALKGKNYTAVSVTDFDPLELARQFTIMESKLYLDVRADEVLELGQSSTPAMNVKAISTLSTAITGWVTECILDEADAKKRTNLVKFFIKVADRCSSLSNFSTSRSILAALDSSTISRLHQTWAAIPQKNRTQLEALRKVADHARNYSEYRSRLRNTNPPAVPFMGLYLTDITFCREGNPNYRASPRDPARQLINVNKYHKLARIVQDMQRFQVPYNLKEIPEIQQYLTAQFEQAKNAGDLHDLYRRSLLVEPRRPADSPITPIDGKPTQIWGLGTLTRNQGPSMARLP